MKKVTVKYILAGVLILSSISFLSKKEVVASVTILVLGIILLPPLSSKLCKDLRVWNNKVVRYFIYILLFAFAGKSLSKQSKLTPLTETIIKKETSNNSDNDEKKISVNSKQKIIKHEVKWASSFTKSELLGKWTLIRISSSGNPSEKIKDKSSDQKVLILTNSKYQTSYPFGSGKNPSFNYRLQGKSLIVSTNSGMNDIYNYKISLSQGGDFLKLVEVGTTQIFKRLED